MLGLVCFVNVDLIVCFYDIIQMNCTNNMGQWGNRFLNSIVLRVQCTTAVRGENAVHTLLPHLGFEPRALTRGTGRLLATMST